MKKIILLSPPYIDTYGGLNIEKINWGIPPTGIAYLGAFLKKNNIKAQIYDLMFEISNLSDVKHIIKKNQPEFIGIGITTPQINLALQLSEIIKSINPNIKIILGGPHPTSLPEESINYKNIDIVVIGEGEHTLLEICQNKPLDEIKGIYYKKNNKIYKNETRNIEHNLDIFPFPLYEQLPIKKYGSFYFGKSIGLVTGRGCPFQCTFCAAKIIDKGIYRNRSNENIIKEIKFLYKKYGFRKFSFWDDTFTLNKNKTKDLCQKIIDEKLNIKWTCNTHCNTIDENLIKLMAKSGCKIIHIGIESASERVLKLIKKNLKLNKAQQTINLAHKYGIIVYGFFMLGFPFETKEEILKTIDFSIKSKIDIAQFSLLTPLPGTEIWNMAINNQGIKFLTKDYNKFLRYGNPIVELPEINQTELNNLFNIAYKKFYLRPVHLIKLGFKLMGLFTLNHTFKLIISFIQFFKSKF